MNTKTDGISSGLLAAAWLSTDCIGERYLCFSKPRDNDPCETLVRLSDAEKLIAEKDAEIKRLSFDLADVLDLKNGVGPTALAAVVYERDKLREEVARLTRERDEAVSAVKRLSEGQSFDAVVVADTAKRIASEQIATLTTALEVAQKENEKVKDLREKNGTIVEAYQEEMLCKYRLALEEIAESSTFGWAQEIAITALKGEKK